MEGPLMYKEKSLTCDNGLNSEDGDEDGDSQNGLHSSSVVVVNHRGADS